MADKMLRIAGRDDTGRARPVEVNNGLLKTGVGDNCLQNDYAVGTVVNPGQVLNVTNLIHFNGGKVSIGVRWKDRSVSFKVRVVGTSHSNAIVSDETVLSVNSQRQNVVCELKQKKSAIYIENTGSTAETLDVITVTQFISESISASQGNGNQYYGLSTDQKPSSANLGDMFLEIDTGNVFVFYSGWRLFS